MKSIYTYSSRIILILFIVLLFTNQTTGDQADSKSDAGNKPDEVKSNAIPPLNPAGWEREVLLSGTSGLVVPLGVYQRAGKYIIVFLEREKKTGKNYLKVQVSSSGTRFAELSTLEIENTIARPDFLLYGNLLVGAYIARKDKKVKLAIFNLESGQAVLKAVAPNETGVGRPKLKEVEGRLNLIWSQKGSGAENGKINLWSARNPAGEWSRVSLPDNWRARVHGDLSGILSPVTMMVSRAFLHVYFFEEKNGVQELAHYARLLASEKKNQNWIKLPAPVRFPGSRKAILVGGKRTESGASLVFIKEREFRVLRSGPSAINFSEVTTRVIDRYGVFTETSAHQKRFALIGFRDFRKKKRSAVMVLYQSDIAAKSGASPWRSLDFSGEPNSLFRFPTVGFSENGRELFVAYMKVNKNVSYQARIAFRLYKTGD